MNNDTMNILGIIIMPFALVIIAIIYTVMQIEYFITELGAMIWKA